MKTNEKTAGLLIVGVGAALLFFLFRNGQAGAALNSVTSPTAPSSNTYTYNIPPLPSANTNFNVNTTDLNVVSYVPLFGFIGVGQFWQ